MSYSTKQVKDSVIFPIFVGVVWGGGGVRHNFWEIWRGVRANLALLRGGYCVIFLLAKLIFRPPPPSLLIIIAQSLICPGDASNQRDHHGPIIPSETYVCGHIYLAQCTTLTKDN